MPDKKPRTVCVYCASSRSADPKYAQSARRLGGLLAEAGVEIVYGGGAVGSMGALADGALAGEGRVVGVLPHFMDEVEWGHTALTELRLVADMHERKRTMLEGVDATVALPGGCGTLEELLEAITWKRLGLFFEPIVVVNQDGYFNPLLATLNRAVDERFMNPQHRAMWSVVESVEQVLPAIEATPPWDRDARSFAGA
ncbi:LOG family protein ORF6 in fasciation locus [Planctomycetes bacterium MalM25]|nr:LOG family protein ORF6 in fasciation locus [Planctomycetes bacterium MalM25]